MNGTLAKSTGIAAKIYGQWKFTLNLAISTEMETHWVGEHGPFDCLL